MSACDIFALLQAPLNDAQDLSVKQVGSRVTSQHDKTSRISCKFQLLALFDSQSYATSEDVCE